MTSKFGNVFQSSKGPQISLILIRSVATTICVCLVQLAAGREAPGYILHMLTIWMGTLFASQLTGRSEITVFIGASKILFCGLCMSYMGNDMKEIILACFLLTMTAVMSQFYKKFMKQLMLVERTTAKNKEVDRMIRVYRDLYQFAPVIFMSLDAKTHAVIDFNKKGVEIFGNALVSGVNFVNLFCEELSRQVRDALNYPNNGMEDESYLKVKDQDKYLTMCVSALEDNESKLKLLHVILIDVTESRQAQQNVNQLNIKLTEAKESAEKSNLDKSRFLAITSHELRTPLHGVICSCDLLNDTKLEPEQNKLVNVIGSCSTILVDLINKIMDFSKIEADAMQLEDARFDLHHVVETVCFGLSSKAIKRKVHLTTSLKPNVPQYVSGDSTRLSQILVNLIGNALKFTEAGGSVHVSVGLHKPDEQDQHFIKFVVKDTGIGIPKSSIPILFNDFSQVDTSTTRKFGGTGLGLAISRRIAELMKGDITVDSEIGVGSTFTFTCAAKKAKQEVNVNSKLISPRESDIVCDLTFVKVLVAEDSSINRAVMMRMLNKLGIFDVVMCPDGEKAVEAFKKQKFNVVLMDGSMPIMDGYIASKTIRSYEAENNLVPTPIIAVTANATSQLMQMCHDAGMTSYLIKPLVVKGLKEGLLSALGMSIPNESTEYGIVDC
ncbi:hybrid signal transduction histidine kinase dhkK [Acrasis kona]|uniref:Hybrid signal transduction histidine kinase dhkK n=1 Tax=Acrasis kona TaxID=1008807 RepID=A0AAW2YSU3_9EUKA